MKCDLDIVFLGGLFPKDTIDEIYTKSIGPIQTAANSLQWNIVRGLDDNCQKPVKIINSLYIGSYPGKYKDLFIKTYSFSHCDLANDINVGFTNLFGVKHLSRYLSLKPFLKEWASGQGENKVLFCYALTAVFVQCLKYIKRINPSISTYMIVPDIPEHMNTSTQKKLVINILKKVEVNYIKNNLEYIDGYVLLTEHMRSFLKTDKKYVVMEGIATDYFANLEYKKVDNFKNIFYSGAINLRYGIKHLVQAFKRIPDKDYRLILCGSGDCENWIRQQSRVDNRIIYKGQLKREEVLKLQMQSTVLINPRQNNEDYTKYSFPSKLLEYLSSGTPVICYKLDGMPKEYDDYISYVGDNSIESLTDKLIEVCSLEQQILNGFGKKAQNFVLNNKNYTVQGKKIIKMLIQEP